MQHPVQKDTSEKVSLVESSTNTQNQCMCSFCSLSLSHKHAKPYLLLFETDSERLHALFLRVLGDLIRHGFAGLPPHVEELCSQAKWEVFHLENMHEGIRKVRRDFN